MEKPQTQKEVLDSIWFAIWGMNGVKGVMKRLDDLEKRPRNRWLAVKDLVLFAIAIGGFLVGSGVLNSVI